MESAWMLVFSMFCLLACRSYGNINGLREEIASLKKVIQKQSEETKKQIIALEMRVSWLEKENNRKNEELTAVHVHRNFSDVFKPFRYTDKSRKRTSTTTVAFHSCLSNDVHYLGRKQTIIFDKVLTDTHSGYARNIGAYRIPSSGYYVVTWVTPVVGNIPMEMIVNGEQKGRTDPSNTGNGASQSRTGIAVLSLYENDYVNIRTHPDASPSGALVSNIWQDACFSIWNI